MKWLFLIVLLFSMSTSATEKDESIFQIQQIQKYEMSDLSIDLVGQPFRLWGKLEKIGKANYVTTNTYKDGVFFTRRYIAKNYIYEENMPLWGEVTGKYTNITKSFAEIEILQYQKIDTPELEKTKNVCQEWVISNLPKYDLNHFKTTERFQVALSHLHDKDLNTSPYQQQEENAINYIDHDKKIIAVECGKSELYTSEIRGDFLSYVAVYDLQQEKLLKVCIMNTGYYLE